MTKIRNNNLDRLLNEISKRPLVIFAGAGINGKTIPQWNELLLSLMEHALSEIAYRERLNKRDKSNLHKTINELYDNGEIDSYAAATLIKRLLGKNYISHLRNKLYEKFYKNEFLQYFKNPKGNGHEDKYKFLIQTAKLCSSPNVHAVVSYNYDNLLEIAIDTIAKRKTAIISPSKGSVSLDKDTLPVYHVHGMVPMPGSKIRASEPNIVLSRDEYFQNMLKPHSWQTTTQLHFLINYPCLFVGTSLKDWNMLRLLSIGENSIASASRYILRRYYFRDKKHKVTDKNNEILNKIRSTLYDDVGVYTISIYDNNELESTIMKITEEMA